MQCVALTQLGKDQNFEGILKEMSSTSLSADRRAEIDRVLRDVAAFADFSVKEHRLLREAGLSEGAANISVGQLWSVRSEISAFKVEPERALNAVRQAGVQACENKDRVKSRKEFQENVRWYGKIIGGSITVINTVAGPPTLGVLTFISAVGGIAAVLLS